MPENVVKDGDEHAVVKSSGRLEVLPPALLTAAAKQTVWKFLIHLLAQRRNFYVGKSRRKMTIPGMLT